MPYIKKALLKEQNGKGKSLDTEHFIRNNELARPQPGIFIGYKGEVPVNWEVWLIGDGKTPVN
ncbi:hypothetical protein [Neobacillus dielmonensis]|uniref:hypothetical protein n=1 Tax=Neobacillus dielmonensis TaxID=1347369 RepID=UPI0012B63A8D|nr:hypothetical protein [Neobacillus dielmonensis]